MYAGSARDTEFYHRHQRNDFNNNPPSKPTHQQTRQHHRHGRQDDDDDDDDEENGAGDDDVSKFWGMPIRPWQFTPMPKEAHMWTCEICQRKKTPLTSSHCWVCGVSRSTSRKYKARRHHSHHHQHNNNSSNSNVKRPSHEDFLAEYARLSQHFAIEMGLLFREPRDLQDAYERGEAGWRALGLIQPPSPRVGPAQVTYD